LRRILAHLRPGRLRLAAGLAAIVALVVAIPVLANLPGSTFEGNDGNLVVDTVGNTDWANAPNRVVGLDQASGPSDNSFGQGTKEDDPSATVVTGSIPPNKNDLTRFYIGSEFVSNSNYLYLAWERAVNIGSANLDLEINQKTTAGFTGTTTGPVTLNRTAGDLLVTYDFAGSGTPTLGLLKWVTTGATSQCFTSHSLPCWGNRVDLSAAGSAEGAVNTGTVTDPVPPGAPRLLTTGLFGEAAINLTAAGVFPAGTCEAFGSTFLKSRASAAFGAEVKDFIAPQPVNISNCGRIKIIKRTNPRGIDQNFSFSSTISDAAPTSCASDLTPSSFTLNDNGNTSSDSAGNTEDCVVLAGSYTVTEGSEPANFVLDSLSCTASAGSSGAQDGTTPEQANITVAPGGLVTCVYVDKQQLGAIKILKTTSKDGSPLAGAQFDIRKASDDSLVSHVTTDANGVACVDQLPFADYKVKETGAPSGYAIDDTTTHTVTVNNVATCGSGNEETTSFSDTPLSRITVAFDSLAAGNPTSATIDCGGGVESLPEGTPKVLDNLPPGTYTCTVVVDP
jgi:hypothetical protein